MVEYKTKHYIRLDAQNRIIKGFSTAFLQPLETDICINEDGGRHFEVLGVINPPFISVNGVYQYKFINGSITERTAEEIQADISAIPHPQPTQLEQLQSTVDLQSEIIADILGGAY